MSSGAAWTSGNAAAESRAATRTRWLSWAFLTALLLFYVAIQGWILKASNFYAYLNDFWFLRQLGDRFTGLNPGALQDGFFPYLYPLLQKLLPESIALQVSASASLIFAIGVIVIIYIAASRIVGPAWALVAAWIVAFQPDFFTYATVAGADMLSAVPVAGSVLLLVLWCAGRHQGSPWLLFWSGFLMAVGGSLRHHVLLLVAIPLIAALQDSESRVRSVLYVIGGGIVAYIPQMVVNLASGHGLYSTLQGFNIYRVVVGVDWNTTASLDPAVYSSPLRIIASYPYEFASSYLGSIGNFTFPLVVIGVAALVLNDTRWRALGWATFFGAIVYAAFTSFAYSSRSLIVLAPIWGLASGVVFGRSVEVLRRIERVPGHASRVLAAWPVAAVAACLLIWGTLPWLQGMVSIGRDRIAQEEVREKQDSAFMAFSNINSMNEVFSNDFNFYVDGVNGRVPRHLGGIAPVSQPGGQGLAIDLSSDVASLLCTSRDAGVTTLVWNPYSMSGVSKPVAEALGEESLSALARVGLGSDLWVIDLRKAQEEACT